MPASASMPGHPVDLATFHGRPYSPNSLNWRHSSHISSRKGRCRLCNMPTLLRDDRGRPCHKVCAEWEADEQANAAAARRPNLS